MAWKRLIILGVFLAWATGCTEDPPLTEVPEGELGDGPTLFVNGKADDLSASARLFDWIAEEDELILLMVYSFWDITAAGHDASLVELLVQKAQQGVPVYLITDRKQSDGVDADGNHVWQNDATEDKLRQGGVHVYEGISQAGPFNAMHHKVGIFGLSSPRIVTDAANWTSSGLGSKTRKATNIESQLFIDSEALDGGFTGRRYLAQWVRVMGRYAAQNAGEHEPTAEETFGRLVALPGWPQLVTDFQVSNAQTSWGESVFVRGPPDALGAWGTRSSGVKLLTDADSYPRWSGGEAELPLGSTFEWKAVIRADDGSAARWEQGENRQGFMIARPLMQRELASQRGGWR